MVVFCHLAVLHRFLVLFVAQVHGLIDHGIDVFEPRRQRTVGGPKLLNGEPGAWILHVHLEEPRIGANAHILRHAEFLETIQREQVDSVRIDMYITVNPAFGTRRGAEHDVFVRESVGVTVTMHRHQRRLAVEFEPVHLAPLLHPRAATKYARWTNVSPR